MIKKILASYKSYLRKSKCRYIKNREGDVINTQINERKKIKVTGYRSHVQIKKYKIQIAHESLGVIRSYVQLCNNNSPTET